MYIHTSIHSNFGKMRLFYFCFAFCTVIVPQMVQPKQSDSLHFRVPGPERFFEKVRVCTIPPTPTPTVAEDPPDLRSGCGRYRTYISGPEFWSEGEFLKVTGTKVLGRFFFLAIHRFSERGWAHPSPSPGWADFSIMIKCTSESGILRVYSVVGYILFTMYRLVWKSAKKEQN